MTAMPYHHQTSKKINNHFFHSNCFSLHGKNILDAYYLHRRKDIGISFTGILSFILMACFDDKVLCLCFVCK